MTDIKQKLEFFLTKEDINRIQIKNDGKKIKIDLHNMKVKEAQRFINNIIAANRSYFTMEVIHGYNRGTALKTMLIKDINNKRIIMKKGIPYNLGLTKLTVAAA